MKLRPPKYKFPKILKVAFLPLAFLLISSLNNSPAKALTANTDAHAETLQEVLEGKPLKLSSFSDVFDLRADAALSNKWFSALSSIESGGSEYRFVGDYRAELDTNLYKLSASQGRLLTRVEGFAFNEDRFFNDRLIDIPELFWEHSQTVGKNNTASFVFGKFANRRFFDKDEIAPDNFDIGERFHFGSSINIADNANFGSLLNTNSLINVVNGQRGNDEPGATNNGAYGFVLGIKNNSRESLIKDGWGFKQAFAVVEEDDINDTFFGATEINKNWGKENPGRLNAGIFYGDNEAFQVISPDDDKAALFYASVVQRYKNFIPYVRWGRFRSETLGFRFRINTVASGFFYEINDRNQLGTHWVHLNAKFNGDFPRATRNIIAMTYRHDFNDYFSSLGFVEFNIDQPLGNAIDLTDNVAFGLNLQGAFK